MFVLVSENQLDEWVRGNSLDAQKVIVELVWRLVAASSPNPRDRRFPLPDSIGQHGPDGIIETDVSFEPFVPEGRSIWEIGTGSPARDKATEDYNDRTRDVPASVREETTFIFVTPRSGRKDWEYTWKEDAQAAWILDRRARKEWKDLRVIDGTRLVDWLHHFPASELWLSQKILGLSVPQIEIPEQRWGILRSYGEPPPLTTQVFLVDRDEACAKLKDVLEDRVVQLKLATHYPEQVTDFVSAYLESLDVETKVEAASRCLIVMGPDAWDTVCSFQQKHILVADAALDLNGDAGTRLIQKARRAGHAIVFCGPHGGIPDPSSVELRMPRDYRLREALISAGYKEERARVLAQKSNSNLSTLLRCLQNLSLLPAWAESTDAAELAIAAVLGSWNEKSDSDRTSIEKISGSPYGEWIGKMRDLALRPGTPLIQWEGNWKFVGRYEGWYSLGPKLFDDILGRLLITTVSVLREKDPQFELSSEERYAARLHGKVPRYSHLLRTGLAESLALLGSHPQALTSCTFGKAESTATFAVRKILADSDWVLWASLGDVLPLLAEAAPNEFLDAVENALHSDSPPFDALFAQEGVGIFGSTYMSGLLWALETLAWDPDLLVRTVVCLGELAASDPGGQWANRPANSLRAILLPWLPHTCAPISKRVTAAKTLIAELPDVGWRLLLALLPQFNSVSSGTRRPAWRATIPDDWRKEVTPKEYWDQVLAFSELAINETKNDISKLCSLVDRLDDLPEPALEKLLVHLKSDVVTTLPEQDRLRLWSNLADLVTKHRKFVDAKWALKPQIVDRIASVADQIAPHHPFFRYQRLFTEKDFDLYESNENYDEQQRQLEQRRRNAIKAVVDAGGVESILAFAKEVQSPSRVGMTLGVVAAKGTDDLVLPSLLESDQKAFAKFAAGFVWSRFNTYGWEWVDSLNVSQWTSDQIGQMLSYMPFAHETWRRAERLLGQDQSPYWKKTTVIPFATEENTSYAIDKFIEYERPYAAIECLFWMVQRKQKLDNARALRALLVAASSSESPLSHGAYEIVEIIKALQDDLSTDPDDLFKVEWLFLQLLEDENGASPKSIERRLVGDPNFFCEIIRLVFRSHKEEVHLAKQPTEQEKRIATNAYTLLSGWRVPPGLLDNGAYNGDLLRSWLEAVKKICAETGHLEIALTFVGHVLTYVPPDPEGLWIHHSAAEALNSRDAEDMREGFRTQLFNSRGAHFVDPTGKPERDLASKYRVQAEAVEAAGYMRFATTLRELADTYEREANQIVARERFLE